MDERIFPEVKIKNPGVVSVTENVYWEN